MSKNKYTTKLTGGGLFVLTIISGLILSAPLVSADNSATNDIRITVPISCNLSSTATTAHTATIDAGTYRNDIGESTITATCNDSGGFAIYAVGYSNDTYGNNTLINTTNANQTIASGTATSGATSNWAMKLTAVEGTYTPTIENNFNAYSAIPTTYTKVASHASNTDVGDEATGAKLKTTYAAYIAPTQYAGTYEGKVKYTLVHPAIDAQAENTAMIIYEPNGSNVRGAMAPQYASGETILTAPNYARAGYGFAGWNTQADGNGTNLGPNQTIDLEDYASLIDEDNNSLTLYAKWIAAEQNVTMQTFDDTLEPYASAAEDTVIALEDERDHDVYAVAKLADGNWWMIENLRIDGSVDAQTMASLSQGVGEGFTKLPESTDNFNGNTFNETYPESLGLTQYTLPQINTSNTVFDAQTDGNVYAYGNYYSWPAAIADTTNYTTSTSVSTSSICPKGWRLPRRGSSGELIALDLALGGTGEAYQQSDDVSNKWRSYPVSFVLSGDYGNSIDNQLYAGVYALPSMPTSDGLKRFVFHFGRGFLAFTTYYAKNFGATVRCIAN